MSANSLQIGRKDTNNSPKTKAFRGKINVAELATAATAL